MGFGQSWYRTFIGVTSESPMPGVSRYSTGPPAMGLPMYAWMLFVMPATTFLGYRRTAGHQPAQLASKRAS
eukprot:1058987-Amphidinium_carterae.1